MESPQSDRGEQEYEVECISKQEGSTAPALVTFPQNIPPPYFLGSNEENADTIELYQLKCQELSKRNQRVLYGTNTKFEWLGKNYGIHTEKTQTSKYLLGLVDPVEKKIKLIEPDVFNLKQYYRLEQSSPMTNLLTSYKPNEQKTLLVEEFGSKKGKKKLQAMRNSVVEEEHISSSKEMKIIFEEKAGELQKRISEDDPNDLHTMIRQKREYLPEFDIQAKTAPEIYKLNSIISPDEWTLLDVSELSNIVKKPHLLQKQRRFFHPLTFRYLEHFSKQPLEKENLAKKLRLTLYLNHLMRFYEILFFVKPLSEFSVETNIPLTIVKSIIGRFYDEIPLHDNKIKFSRSSVLTDKLICYIFILCLFIHDFHLNLIDLCQTMKYDLKKMQHYSREIGCTKLGGKAHSQSEGEQAFFVQLKAPLRFLSKLRSVNRTKQSLESVVEKEALE